jgi:hypothetical protein
MRWRSSSPLLRDQGSGEYRDPLRLNLVSWYDRFHGRGDIKIRGMGSWPMPTVYLCLGDASQRRLK